MNMRTTTKPGYLQLASFALTPLLSVHRSRSDQSPSRELAEKRGGFNRSVQHHLM
jgi:hypothetical protein